MDEVLYFAGMIIVVICDKNTTFQALNQFISSASCYRIYVANFNIPV